MSLVLALLSHSGSAGATTESTPVVVLETDGPLSGPGAALLTRLRAELAVEGFDVAGNADSNVPASSGPVIASVRISGDADQLSVLVRLEQSSGDSTREREFQGEARDARVLVLRAVEYIRSSQIQFAQRQAKRDAISPPKAPSDLHWLVALGASGLVGVPGKGPGLGGSVGFGYRIHRRDLWLELRATGLAKTSLENEKGTASFRHSLGTLGLRWNALATKSLGFIVAASAGGYLLQSRGSSRSTLVARDEIAVVPAVLVGAGAFFGFGSAHRFKLVLRSDALMTLRRPVVRFGNTAVDGMALPSLQAWLGMEVGF
ncbi:MAG: hypothetical protein ACOY0T_18280 [Myxococcota bacterium]